MTSFSRIIGQRTAKERIRPLLMNRPEQVYLITGPEGIGKRLFASAMAKVLLCDNPSADRACDTCGSCRFFVEGTHPDFIRVSPQPGEKNIRVAVVREKVVRDVSMYPQISRRKVYLIEADSLNEEGQNALLKTLEEPPSSVVIILTVSDTDKLLDTIVSRSVTIPLSPNPDGEIMEILSAKTSLDDQGIALVTAVSKGVPGVGLRMAEDESLSGIRENIADLLNSLPVVGCTDLLSDRYSFFEENKDRIGEILAILQMGLGDIAMLISNRNHSILRVIDKRDNIMRMIDNKSISNISVDRASVAVTAASRAMKSNYNFESTVCTMLLSVQKELSHAESS
ncbi:MAG: hypothetical protein JW780_02270 [Clostridiales bacterium]|nr:hypothetical protein [Clostridiales bacterium]